MNVSVQFYYDFGSPNTYYCHRVIPAIEQRTGVRFEYVPILLGGIFKATNNKSPMEAFGGIKNKPEYNALETKRFIAKHALNNFKSNPHFPVNTLALMRGAVFAKGRDFEASYIEAMYRCMWEREMNMADADVIAEALADANLPADAIIAGSASPEVKQQLIANTQAAVDRGVFGAPTFFVGDEMYFGKDRLREVEEEIESQSTRS